MLCKDMIFYCDNADQVLREVMLVLKNKEVFPFHALISCEMQLEW